MVIVDEQLTRIPIMPSTRDRLRAMKRGQESYDDLLRAMLERLREAGWRVEPN